MISSISSNLNWYPSLFQNTNQAQNNANQSNLFGITNVDSYAQQSVSQQNLNQKDQQSSNPINMYDLLNNISNNSSLYGITNIDDFTKFNYQLQSNPSLSPLNQAMQSYQTNQDYTNNIFNSSSLYNQTT
ncbi:hypothetical protein [Heyndrickxia acidicola]|uniref:Uncharacterized protein n=1 Tax=Heyndrickxia acidicola TaxID=209389 RepID=A0ABU6MJ76_9BACI|nr:hypothetical protein [Heyndrickxia acidicola]MED1203282.1 hypothetical protein [Heyndrickxia acidicola]